MQIYIYFLDFIALFSDFNTLALQKMRVVNQNATYSIQITHEKQSNESRECHL